MIGFCCLWISCYHCFYYHLINRSSSIGQDKIEFLGATNEHNMFHDILACIKGVFGWVNKSEWDELVQDGCVCPECDGTCVLFGWLYGMIL